MINLRYIIVIRPLLKFVGKDVIETYLKQIENYYYYRGALLYKY